MHNRLRGQGLVVNAHARNATRGVGVGGRPPRGLFHSDGLSQVSWLIHVIPLGLSHGGGKDLQGHGGQQRLHQSGGLRDTDDMVSVI